MDRGLHFWRRDRHSSAGLLRRMLMCLLAFLTVLTVSATVAPSASAGINHPVQNGAYQTTPVDFYGSASLNLFRFFPSVSIRLYQIQEFSNLCNPTYGTCYHPKKPTVTGAEGPVGHGEDNLDIDGDWRILFSDLISRGQIIDGDIVSFPQGTPLHDGKYHLHIFQLDHTVGFGNLDSPDHNRWGVSFWIDSKPPDTVIKSVTPIDDFTGAPRLIKYHTEEDGPGSPTDFECRIDGGPWFGKGVEFSFDNPEDFACRGVADLPTDLVGRYSEYTVDATGEGKHTFEVRAVDLAGNVDPTPAKVEWYIDGTPPEITLTKPAMRERFTLGEHVPAAFECEDPLTGSPPYASGIKTCSGPSTVDTSQLGNFRFVVNAEDHAGNTHQVVHSYAVDPPKYADVIKSNGPLAYYRLGDPLGSNRMADSSGHDRHGEFRNAVALKRPPAPACHVRPHAPYTCDLNADPEDWSAFFPARDGYGFTNNVTAPTTAYTWEAWINRADNRDGMIAAHGGGGQLFVKDGRLALRQTQDTVHATGPVLTPGEWYHVAGTWNGSTTRLYVNGNQVGSSSSANKPPSGTATLYVGYGDQAPWFHGQLDEVAYYGSALSQSTLRKRWVVGTARDVPSPVPDGPPIQRPSADIHSIANGGLYAPTKVPALEFECNDLDGDHTVASCSATVDGNPVDHGDSLPDTPGTHTVTVTAIDDDGLTRSHTHKYTVTSFQEIYNADEPVAYYRLGDAAGEAMKDSGPHGRHGTYKNAQESGPVGISGDSNLARKFFGQGGYGFIPAIPAPKFQSTIEAWVNPDDLRDQSVTGHGDAGEIYIAGGRFHFRHVGTTVSSQTGPVPGAFTQVVGVWDGVTIAIYVDGELQGRTEATTRPSSSSTFYVGYGELRPWFKGSLDEVAYYGKALTPARILEHYLADPPPDRTGPAPGDPAEQPQPPETDPPDGPATNPGPGTEAEQGPPQITPGGGSDEDVEAGGATTIKTRPDNRAKPANTKCGKLKKKSRARYKRCVAKRQKARSKARARRALKKCRKFKPVSTAKFRRCTAKHRRR